MEETIKEMKKKKSPREREKILKRVNCINNIANCLIPILMYMSATFLERREYLNMKICTIVIFIYLYGFKEYLIRKYCKSIELDFPD